MSSIKFDYSFGDKVFIKDEDGFYKNVEGTIVDFKVGMDGVNISAYEVWFVEGVKQLINVKDIFKEKQQ